MQDHDKDSKGDSDSFTHMWQRRGQWVGPDHILQICVPFLVTQARVYLILSSHSVDDLFPPASVYDQGRPFLIFKSLIF